MTHRNDSVYDPRLQCHGKRGYGSQTKAKRHARRANQRSLFVYRCPHCNLFHLGHRR